MYTIMDMLDLSTNEDIPSSSAFVDKVVSPMKINSTRDLAAVVRGRRLDLHLSQAELASQVGVSRNWLNQVEAGKRSLDFALVLRLLDVLGLSLDIVNPGDASDVFTGRSVDLDTIIEGYRGQ
ncbi:MAG TPA: helix-turn-helix domain-containing protein [Acidimicrobiales bacterium]